MKPIIRMGTLESKIYSVFTVLIFCTIIVMQVLMFRFTLDAVRSSMLKTNGTLLGQLGRQVDSYIDDMEMIARAVAEDRNVQGYLASGAEEAAGRLAIEQQLRNYLEVREDISDIMIIRPDDLFISAHPEHRLNPWMRIEDHHWYRRSKQAYAEAVVSTSYVQNLVQGRYSWVISLGRGIVSRESGNSLGVLLVDLKFNRIKSLCRSYAVGKKGYNFIIDQDANYIYHPSLQLLYSNLRREPLPEILDLLEDEGSCHFDGTRYYMISTLPVTGWHVVSVIYEDDMSTDWRSVHFSFTLMGLILFLVVGVSTKHISQSITKPVKKLSRVMKSVDTGEFRFVGELRASDEIRQLAREYDTMVGRIRQLIAANKREQELKRKSDLKALQAQINPHFLYNTLDSIIWMAEMEQSEKVVEMTSALSKLFRISISKGQDFISIASELAHVESYLTIQQMRYRDIFDYELAIDPDIYHYTTLKITLQPLVENAIYHGIKEKGSKGLIRISGWREEDSLIMEVLDNGVGMSGQQLEELRCALEGEPSSFSSSNRIGMGIRNVHQRIRIHFGSPYGLVCSSTAGEGTRIRVHIPLRRLEDSV